MKHFYATTILLITLCTTLLRAQSTVTITSQPADVPNCSKSSVQPAAFSVAATATGGDLSYQWQSFDGTTWTDLPNSTYPDYIATGANTAQIRFGFYMYTSVTVRCAITATSNGTPSTVYSQSASTLLVGRPVIQSGPTGSEYVCAGSTVNLSVSETGYGLKYKWRKYASDVPLDGTGTDSPTLTLTNVQPATNGVYYAEVSNVCGTVSSPTYQLITAQLPVISQQPPATKQVTASQTNSLCATADNGGKDLAGIRYYTQWETRPNASGTWVNVPSTVDGSNGGPYTSGTHCLSNLPILADGQQYRLKLYLPGCPDVLYSSVTTLQMQSTSITITAQPANQQACVNGNSNFTVAANGNGLSYQWETRDNTSSAWNSVVDGVNASGAATAQLTVFGSLQTNGRQIRVKVSAPGVSSVYSNAATLSLKGPVAFTQHPADMSICPAGTARFQVGINSNGAGTVAIRWEYSNGSAWVAATGSGFSGGTTGILYVSGAQLVHGRQFRVVASASSCPTEVISNLANLKVDVAYAPTVAGVTPEITVPSGTTAQVIPVTASGGNGALKITWSRTNVTPLSFNPALAQSGTDAEFTVVRTVTSTATTNQTMVFTVKATDAVGCSSTALAKMTVQPGSAGARFGFDAENPVSVLTLYPNPFNGRVLHIRGGDVDQKSIMLFNVAGAALPVNSRALEAELTEVKPMETLTSGVYFVKVQQGGQMQYHRVLVE